jgi:hypothetical protein
MKRFFRFFVCILFSVSLFSRDVFASSNNVYSLISSRVGRTSVSTINPSVSYIPIRPNSASVGVYLCTARYTFVDYVYLQFIDLPSPRSGVYSINSSLTYTLDIAPVPLGNGSSPAASDFSVSCTFGSLPEGLSVSPISLPSTLDSKYDCSLTFLMLGSTSFRASGTYKLIESLPVPIIFDIVYSSVYVNSSLNDITYPSVSTLFAKGSCSPTNPNSKNSAFFVSSDSSQLGVLGDIDNTIKDQHQEEIDKAEETGSSVTGSSNQLTGTLSAWEIFTMPFQLVKDFVQAISSDGNTGFTFPSFSMMGYEIWPSYTFDLNTIKSNFPVLYNGVHLVSGTIVVSGFIHYCWRKWSILMGDDMPEDSGSAGGGS